MTELYDKYCGCGYKVTTDSRENKGGCKVKLHHETRKVREYLESRV